MIDLDERLDGAARSVRSQVNSVPVRPPAEIVRRRLRSQAVTAVSGLAVVALVVVGSALVFGGVSDVAGQPGPAEVPAYSYTLDLPDWSLVAVWEAEDGSGRSHTLFDEEGSSANALRRVKIDTGSAATERHTTLQARDVQPVETFSVSGSQAGLYLTAEDPLLGWTTVIATWTGPQDEQVAVLFEGIALEEAKDLLTGLTPLDLRAWESLTSAYEPSVTTTIDSRGGDSPERIEEPIEEAGTELAVQLSNEVLALPGFPSDVIPKDALEVNDEQLIASFIASDGGLIDVVMQRLSEPLPIEVIDPSGTAHESRGPQGESIIYVDKEHTIQLVAVDTDGLMANLIIERINRAEPNQPSSLKDITQQAVTEWALALLSTMRDDL